MKRITLLLFILFVFSCSGDQINQDFEEASFACATAKNKHHQAAHDMVADKRDVQHRLRYHYFTNGKKDVFTKDFFHKRTEVLNHNYIGTRRSFVVEDVITYTESPEDYEVARKVIEGIETKGPRKDLREKFIIEQFAFWGWIFESDDAIDVFVYDVYDSGFAGVALAIQSKTIAVRWDYMDPLLTLDTKEEKNTLEHEIGHALGLPHTHHDDKNEPTDGFNNDFGDKICDTPKTPSDLFKFIDDDCNVKIGVFPAHTPKKCIENSTKNYMSYTKGFCREIFTPDQVREMDDALESNRDLRATSPNFDNIAVMDIPDVINIDTNE
jgi:hypothetical protein